MFNDGKLRDRELWDRIVAGDATVFGEWYCAHAPRLKIFLRRLLGSEPAAEDVLQETFARIWRRPVGYAPERGPLRAWLFGVARRRAADWKRRQKPEETMAFEPAQPGGAAERHSILADVLGQLADDQRALLWLREVEGYSYQELSGILEIPVSTVRSRLHAAREALRGLWRSEQTTEGGSHELH